MAQTTDKISLNIILIGKAGHGKSATGNSILGRAAFKRYPHLHSGTQVVTDASAQYGEYDIKVVDGPGFRVTDLDDVKNKEQMFENMTTALRMCNRGVHIFVLVIKFRFRYTEEDRKAIYGLKTISGENYLIDRGIIVMTGGYYFSGQMEADGTPGKTFIEWCREQDTVLGNLIEECSPRVVLFNNLPTSEEEQARQRNELLFHAEQLQRVKGLYTTEHFQAYAQKNDKFIKDSKQKIFEETIQKRIDLLSAELERLSIDSSLEDVDTLDTRITDVYTEIGEENLQEESMQQLTDCLKRLRTTTEELRRAIREKNPRAVKLTLVVINQHREELNTNRKTPWGGVAALVRAAIVRAAVTAAIAPVILSLIINNNEQKVKGLYTTKHFEKYAQVRSKFINDSKQNIFEKTIKKRIDMLSANLERLSIDSCLEDVDKLDARITGVFMEIGDERLQEESLQKFISSLEGLRTATEELRRSIREKKLSAMKSNLIEECRQKNQLPCHAGQLQKILLQPTTGSWTLEDKLQELPITVKKTDKSLCFKKQRENLLEIPSL